MSSIATTDDGRLRAVVMVDGLRGRPIRERVAAGIPKAGLPGKEEGRGGSLDTEGTTEDEAGGAALAATASCAAFFAA